MTENSLFCDKEYQAWIMEIKERIRLNRIKASVRINSTMIELYWSIGSDIVERQAENRWGSSVVEQMSRDLRSEFPEAQGFSTTNLYHMKRFYLFYGKNATKLVADSLPGAFLHQLGGEIDPEATGHMALSPPSDDSSQFPPVLATVPWRHHVEIFTHCKSLPEALFYVSKTIENGWSRSALQDKLRQYE